jgi:hypothetical protein
VWWVHVYWCAHQICIRPWAYLARYCIEDYQWFPIVIWQTGQRHVHHRNADQGSCRISAIAICLPKVLPGIRYQESWIRDLARVQPTSNQYLISKLPADAGTDVPCLVNRQLGEALLLIRHWSGKMVLVAEDSMGTRLW